VAFTDTDLRPDYPTLTRAQWFDVLASSGYEAIVTLPQQAGAERSPSAGIPAAGSHDTIAVAPLR